MILIVNELKMKCITKFYTFYDLVVLIAITYLPLIDDTIRSYAATHWDVYWYTAELPQDLCPSPRWFGKDLLRMLQTFLWRFQAIAGADDHVLSAACSGQAQIDYVSYICFRACGIFHVNKIKWEFVTVPVNHAGFVPDFQWRIRNTENFV